VRGLMKKCRHHQRHEQKDNNIKRWISISHTFKKLLRPGFMALNSPAFS
jgi:hypothetical protein